MQRRYAINRDVERWQAYPYRKPRDYGDDCRSGLQAQNKRLKLHSILDIRKYMNK